MQRGATSRRHRATSSSLILPDYASTTTAERILPLPEGDRSATTTAPTAASNISMSERRLVRTKNLTAPEATKDPKRLTSSHDHHTALTNLVWCVHRPPAAMRDLTSSAGKVPSSWLCASLSPSRAHSLAEKCPSLTCFVSIYLHKSAFSFWTAWIVHYWKGRLWYRLLSGLTGIRSGTRPSMIMPCPRSAANLAGLFVISRSDRAPISCGTRLKSYDSSLAQHASYAHNWCLNPDQR